MRFRQGEGRNEQVAGEADEFALRVVLEDDGNKSLPVKASETLP